MAGDEPLWSASQSFPYSLSLDQITMERRRKRDTCVGDHAEIVIDHGKHVESARENHP